MTNQIEPYPNEFKVSSSRFTNHRYMNGHGPDWTDKAPHQRLFFMKHSDGQLYLTTADYSRSGSEDLTYGVFPIGWYEFFWNECDRLKDGNAEETKLFKSLIQDMDSYMNATTALCRNYFSDLGDHRHELPFFNTETDFAFGLVADMKTSLLTFGNRFKAMINPGMMFQIEQLNAKHEVVEITQNTLIRIGLMTYIRDLNKRRNEASWQGKKFDW